MVDTPMLMRSWAENFNAKQSMGESEVFHLQRSIKLFSTFLCQSNEGEVKAYSTTLKQTINFDRGQIGYLFFTRFNGVWLD